MTHDLFRDLLVPTVGGLGIFMFGLELMAQGIQALAVNRMRRVLQRVAGTSLGGLLAGTVITGIIQSSTAMTVMVVGLVNAGVLGLRPAIAVIMGANIGTTLTNALIALPLGLWGLFGAGLSALVVVFARRDGTRNLWLAILGFCLVFYGLGLLTSGLRPLRDMPGVMAAIAGLEAGGYLQVLYCVLVAAGISALIHSSSATIGIIMGLGASGVLDWRTALACALGADLGTTVTSFIAALNLTRDAKRAAFAHIGFNVAGVAAMFPVFPAACRLVAWIVGDPGVPVTADGAATYPLVPVAVGAFSILFNIFNTALLFPFIGAIERLLLRVGHAPAEDIEDFSVPRFIGPETAPEAAVPAIRREIARLSWAATLFVHAARRRPGAPDDIGRHRAAIGVLEREIAGFAARTLDRGLPQADGRRVASLVAEAGLVADLGEALHRAAHDVLQAELSPAASALAHSLFDRMELALEALDPDPSHPAAALLPGLRDTLVATVDATLSAPDTRPGERGSILTLIGTAGRVFDLIEDIDAMRRRSHAAG
ncbi:MAG: Na/Pi cotransporter family protein [Alphaproteobacteria bacterium]